MKIVTKKTISKECWNLDWEIINWLNEHLKVYKKEAGKNIDLTFYKFTYKRKEYTQEEIIDRLIEITDFLVDIDIWDCDTKLVNKMKDEMYDLLKLVHFCMWW